MSMLTLQEPPLLKLNFEYYYPLLSYTHVNASYVGGGGTKNLTFNWNNNGGSYTGFYTHHLDYENDTALFLNGGNILKNNKEATLRLPSRKSLSKTRNISIGRLFRSTWDTRKIGSGHSNSTQIKIPGEFDGFAYLSGGYERVLNTGNDHFLFNLSKPDIYQINIVGSSTKFGFNNAKDRNKIISIEKWDHVELSNNGGHFYGAENLERISGSPS